MKPILLVVENRPTIYIEYTKWLIKQTIPILFWEGDKAPIWHMRKELIKSALKTDCTHILFVDTDVIPPDGFIEKLLSYKKDIVSGVYHIFTGIPCSQKNGKYYQGKGFEEVDVCSMGACLIKREVLKKVKYPKPRDHSMDADARFCKQVKEAGFKIYQDFDLKCFHIQIVPIIGK